MKSIPVEKLQIDFKLTFYSNAFPLYNMEHYYRLVDQSAFKGTDWDWGDLIIFSRHNKNSGKDHMWPLFVDTYNRDYTVRYIIE